VTTRNDIRSRMKGGTKPAKPAAVAPVHKIVRTTLDIDPNLYAQLMSLCNDVATAVGRVKVTQVTLMREMIREAVVDQEFRARLIQRVQTTLDEMDAAKGKAKQ
jgi:hypothetical protein